MARADRRRAGRASRTAEVVPTSRVAESPLFFERLRRQAKWMFVFLAAVFGIGFVAFGVGSDVQGGIADVLQGRAPNSGPSVGDARERVRENPRDPQALRDLATALAADGKAEEAIEPLERYLALRPRDGEALRELAGLHLTRAARLRDEAIHAQERAQALAPGAELTPPASTPLGQVLGRQPVLDAVRTDVDARFNEALQAMQDAYDDAKQVYVRIARLEPRDASLQLQLADAAIQANDVDTAAAAYRRFLRLAPDDPNAPIVRQRLAEFQRSSAGTATAGG